MRRFGSRTASRRQGSRSVAARGVTPGGNVAHACGGGLLPALDAEGDERQVAQFVGGLGMEAGGYFGEGDELPGVHHDGQVAARDAAEDGELFEEVGAGRIDALLEFRGADLGECLAW